jgi:hypothetical protein
VDDPHRGQRTDAAPLRARGHARGLLQPARFFLCMAAAVSAFLRCRRTCVERARRRMFDECRSRMSSSEAAAEALKSQVPLGWRTSTLRADVHRHRRSAPLLWFDDDDDERTCIVARVRATGWRDERSSLSGDSRVPGGVHHRLPFRTSTTIAAGKIVSPPRSLWRKRARPLEERRALELRQFTCIDEDSRRTIHLHHHRRRMER